MKANILLIVSKVFFPFHPIFWFSIFWNLCLDFNPSDRCQLPLYHSQNLNKRQRAVPPFVPRYLLAVGWPGERDCPCPVCAWLPALHALPCATSSVQHCALCPSVPVKGLVKPGPGAQCVSRNQGQKWLCSHYGEGKKRGCLPLVSPHFNQIGFFSLVIRTWLGLARLTQCCHSVLHILDRHDDHLYWESLCFSRKSHMKKWLIEIKGSRFSL